jgi:molybdopterin converting factor small subunit
MARVYIPAMLRPATEGREWVSASGGTVRDVVAGLELAYPGLAGRLVREGRLVPGLAVAIDGDISGLGLAEAVAEETEVQFLTAISGGSGVKE